MQLFLLGLTLIFSCVLPLRWVFRFWLAIAIVVTGLIAFKTQESFSNDGGGARYILGIAKLMFYEAALSAVVIVRLIIARFRKKNSEVLPPEKNILYSVDIFLMFIAGLILSIHVFKSIAFILQSLPYGFAIHVGVVLLSVTSIIPILKYARQDKKSKSLIFMLALACGILFLSIVGIFYPYAVTKSAIMIAKDKPYCIGLNSRHRSLKAYEDLTLLTMDKGKDDHHAVLLVEKEDSTFEPYHWSYLQTGFLPGVINWNNEQRSSISCRPEYRAIEKIPLIGALSDKDDVEYYFNENFLKIPAKYHPRVSSHYISIAVRTPDFESVEREKGFLYAGMEIRSRAWLESIHEDYNDLTPTGKIGNLYEIKNAKNGNDWYYRFDDDGNLTTAIGCYADRGFAPQCQHRFYRDGAMYSFDHDKDLLPHSEEMEDKLFALFESFKDQ